MPNQVRHGKRLYKQMAMEVAVRNPERYKGILSVISKYENKVLDDSCILEIYADLFLSKVVDSNNIDIDNSSKQQVKIFIKSNLTHQNEWGFPTGYQAAFTRYLKTLSELGLIYTQYNDKVEISAVAKAWLKDEIEDAEVFALQCMRFWRKSPYRRVLNDFNYFKFILQVLLKLKQEGKTLSYPQFILSLFSDNGNIEEFLCLINTYRYGNDIDKMYDFIVQKYGNIDDLHPKVNKQSTVCNDYGNTVFRVLQLTGLITVNSTSGVLTLSINEYKENLLKKLLNQNFTISEDAKENEILYFNEIGTFSPELKSLIILSRENEQSSVENYNEVMKKIIQTHNITLQNLTDWLYALSNNRNDSSSFWYIQKPLKFEFFVSLVMFLNYGDNLRITPNYKTDTNGIPYQHAPGNIGDISLSSNEISWLIEVTLIRSKIQQLNSETADCIRHFEQNVGIKNYLTFIAPYVHPDTVNYYDNEIINLIRRRQTLTYIKPYNTIDFIDLAEQKLLLQDMEEYKTKIYNELKESFS